MLLPLPTAILSPPPTAANCLCMWERPPRGVEPRPRLMKQVNTKCPSHGAVGQLVVAVKAAERGR